MLIAQIGQGEVPSRPRAEVKKTLRPLDQLIFHQSVETSLGLLPKIFPNYMANQTGYDRYNQTCERENIFNGEN